MKRIILAGGSGFLGQVLAEHFQKAGYEVVGLTRSPSRALRAARQVVWDGRTLGSWAKELEGATAVINLAGRSVNCRYNPANRNLIWESRVFSTRVLGVAMAGCQPPPRVWLNASTATIYRHTFGPAWDESGEIGGTLAAKDEFSVEVAQAWEQALNGAAVPRTRRVAMRSAMVLGQRKNSVLPVLQQLVSFGLGGRMGSGRQFVSWIHEADFCRAVEWLIMHDEMEGAVNICAPGPVTNAEMMRLFRVVCRRPWGLPATQWMLTLGAFFLRTETELILKSRRVVPGRLVKSGFEFQFPELGPALENLLRGKQDSCPPPVIPAYRAG